MMAFHCDRHALPLPAQHPFPAGKYARLRERLAGEITGPWRLAEAPPAGDEELATVHTAAYVDAVMSGGLSPTMQREIGLPWSVELVERSRHSVGATIAAARAARVEGVAVTLAGGTHHAHADRGSGYCVFNDVAVATRVLQAEHRRATGCRLDVLVIDLDVHQGDGTAAIFAADASVFTLSLHGSRNFPARKAAGDLDVGLPDGCTDTLYIESLESALDRVWSHYGEALPGLAFYLAGADPHEGDRLGRLRLSFDGLARRDRAVFAALSERRIPVAVCMAGGYGRDIEDTVSIHVRTVQEAARAWQAMQSSFSVA